MMRALSLIGIASWHILICEVGLGVARKLLATWQVGRSRGRKGLLANLLSCMKNELSTSVGITLCIMVLQRDLEVLADCSERVGWERPDPP